jgi:hypothetical protein
MHVTVRAMVTGIAGARARQGQRPIGSITGDGDLPLVPLRRQPRVRRGITVAGARTTQEHPDGDEGGEEDAARHARHD